MSANETSMPKGSLPAQVQATIAYFGVASAYRINMSLDGEPDIEVIIMARDVNEVARFFSHIGTKDFDPTKTIGAALVKREVVLSKQEQSRVDDDDEL